MALHSSMRYQQYSSFDSSSNRAIDVDHVYGISLVNTVKSEAFENNESLKLNVSSNAAVKSTFDICWAMSSNIASDVSN